MKMRKKYLIGMLTMASAAFLTSCATQVPELSKLDNDKAAEYMAGEMLKYDKNYAYALDYDRSVLQTTPTPAPTKVPATPTPKPGDSQQDPVTEGGAPAGEAPALQEVSLSEVFGIGGVDIRCTAASIKDSYGKGYESIVAPEGKKLLIVKFKITNTGAASQKLDLFKNKMNYTVVQGEQKNAPLRTSAAGDLQYFKTDIASGKSKQGILIFEVGQDTKAEESSLQITNGTKQATVALP